MDKCDIGIYGLALMGQNLAINFANRGFSVSVFNRREAGEENIMDTFISSKCQEKRIIGSAGIKEFVDIVEVSAGCYLLLTIYCICPGQGISRI